MAQHIVSRQIGALGKRGAAGRPQHLRGVLPSSPYRFHLNMPQPAHEGLRRLISQIPQRDRDRILTPALGICLYGLLEKTIERASEVRSQIAQLELQSNLSGLG